MNKHAACLKGVSDLLNTLISQSKSKTSSDKLEKINTVCKGLIDNGASPSISNVVKHLNQEGVKISTRSIYNKREGGNPYRTLIDAWIECSTSMFTQKKIKTKQPIENEFDFGIIDENDLSKISDPALRYRIMILVGEVKGLKSQLNIAREIENLPILKSDSPTKMIDSDTSESIMLNPYEVDIISSLLSGTHSLEYSQDGALSAKTSIKRGEMLSSPGLKDALKKIIKSYTHPSALS